MNAIKKVTNRIGYRYRNFLWHRSLKHNNQMGLKSYYDSHYHMWTVQNHVALYDMREGKELDDSPFSLMRYWLNHPAEITDHVIVVEAKYRDKFKRILDFWRLNDDSRIHLVDYGTADYLQYLLTAKYVITNAMIFSDVFVKRPDQIFINTWHGTPLKKMGYAMSGGVMGSWNVLRNLLMTDYLVMPNQYTADIFKKDYRLNNIYRGKILVEGYPRNDVLVNQLAEEQVTDISHQFNKIGAKRILYAPTWSGEVTGENTDLTEIDRYFSVLEQINQVPQLEIKFKPHPYFAEAITQDTRFDSYLVNDAWGTNDLLSEVDVLVTDYSSLFFDFLVTGKPIVFFDTKTNYQEERGGYIDNAKLPGPYTKNVLELLEILKNLSKWQDKYQEVYSHYQQRFVAKEDGKASERVANIITKSPIKNNNNELHVLVNGEDFTNKQFENTNIVEKLSQNYDVSVAVYESHLLDNWYGYQFFQNIDAVMPISRIFVNKNTTYKSQNNNELEIMGRRVTGNSVFDVLIILQTELTMHQKMLLTVTKSVLMTSDVQREAYMKALGFVLVKSYSDLSLWCKGNYHITDDLLFDCLSAIQSENQNEVYRKLN